ncbi:hypothetical protein OTK49_02130 [Vibrio coralliirubri]|uniref:hypothetical protein n=1 Tax=Vibrio coralliirubri TaxID=1516159 RepID=UPI002283AF4F|nr:hypothetical protein [Vibrio coralliirubri]MCY9861313.1 hypothetical protein [Vibrio coralliirubri]
MNGFKKLAALTLFSVLSFSASAMDNDKIMHLTASSAIGFAANGYFDNHQDALVTCLSVGLAKEIYDEIDYGGFSGQDLVADAIGCGLGVVSAEYLGFRLGFERNEGASMITFNVDF